MTRPERREQRGPRTRNSFSTPGQFIPHVVPLTRHVPGWSTLGDQTGPVDIRGARPLHSGCCEAVLECASHAVDSRIFGSMKPPLNKKKKQRNKKIFLSFFFNSHRRRTSVRRAAHPPGVHSSAVEHGIADPGVAGSIPAAPCPA